MRPFSEFTDLLFKPAGVSSERIVTFSCGHVIPEGNLLSISMSHGPSTNGPKLEFSYSQRMNEQVIEETGRTLSKLASAVPGGIVVFFASYDYEQKVYSQWERNGLIEQLQEKGKRVFREPRKSNQVNQVLIEYARTIRMAKTSERNNGAFLFSVVGGKMSEGINFSNELGRCVVMVGLPYGNIMSPELREKMNYLDKEQGHGKGRFYYENLCMKSVNQSIGRAIRHKDDYSVILLLDHRYCCRQDIKNALPRWIGDKLRIEQKFEHVLDAIMKFFADKS
ncbi:ATP-dependent DNA helicase DDX11 [Halotydeus destructor]|nr:ATP-dependent DNA helicase DDX11 [Halotydeus destructor]